MYEYDSSGSMQTMTPGSAAPVGGFTIAGITLSTTMLLVLGVAGYLLFSGKVNPFGEMRRNPSPYRKRKSRRSRHVRRKRSRRAGKRMWMRGAVKRPGALRAWVQRTYGSAGFDSQGRIKTSVLRKHYHDKGKTGQRVRLAATFRGLRVA